MTQLDGNAAAGALSEVFTGDPTTATATCAACGVTGALAAVAVYEGPGTVLRCPACDAVLMRLARIRDAIHMEMRGISALRMRRTA